MRACPHPQDATNSVVDGLGAAGCRNLSSALSNASRVMTRIARTLSRQAIVARARTLTINNGSN